MKWHYHPNLLDIDVLKIRKIKIFLREFKKSKIFLRSSCLLKTYFIAFLFKMGTEGPNLYNSYRKCSKCRQVFLQMSWPEPSRWFLKNSLLYKPASLLILIHNTANYESSLIKVLNKIWLGDDSFVWRKLCVVNFCPIRYLHPAASLRAPQNSYSAWYEHRLLFVGQMPKWWEKKILTLHNKLRYGLRIF